jgi:tryptophan synthase alpha chain
MNRITKIFNDLKKTQGKAFIPFITAGDGGLDLTLELMHGFAKNGASIIEIGVPFSDPMADGGVIASSHERAVASGISLKNVFDLVVEFRKTNDKTGVVLMGYLNPIEIYGYEKFATDCKKYGVDGVLVVDNPPEEAMEFKQLLDKNSVDLIFLVAPTTTNARLEKLKTLVSGFVYFVSLKGITGSGGINVFEVNANLERIKKHIDLPICVGFGIKNAETAAKISKNSDGVIVGSAIVKLVEQNSGDKGKIISSIDNLTKQIIEVL